ncbi:MAG TPA: GMC family oxidoreductase [Candidatus Baltobacteraceae bacterium]|nr:GMC family oxidoreductase [Candidatus Baltobacteraceae bacterium]
MIRDIVAEGIARGWRVHDAAALGADTHVDADVAIIGTGAGGGTAAEILSQAGLHVVLIEEGPLRSSSDFHMLEREAYPQLYQESAGRRTKDKGITILQGRSVGGSTTVNWTSSFRTPPETLAYWRERFGLRDFEQADLAPWFARMEQRLNVHPWDEPPNQNNGLLRAGAAKLGIPTSVIPRNVKGCWNLGYCGMGCPTNAKQSMLVTTIPSALEHGATLFYRARAEQFSFDGTNLTSLRCRAMQPDGITPSAHTIAVRARHYILAAGAIGSPAVLLRSGLPDPYRRVGKRTFLHPTLVSAAIMPHPVRGFSGAPQSIYSDHFLQTQPIDAEIGYKLEVPPLHPVLMATTLVGFGEPHAKLMAQAANVQVIIALLRDGFSAQSEGGTVGLKSDGTPLLDYPITPYVWDGARRALQTMAHIQFAAGASAVLPLHENAVPYTSLAAAQRAIAAFPMEILRTRVVSAHVMGGCGMGREPQTSVVDGYGSHHHVGNLSVFDGSVFPTSVGANPQLSIYAITARNASRLARSLTG